MTTLPPLISGWIPARSNRNSGSPICHYYHDSNTSLCGKMTRLGGEPAKDVKDDHAMNCGRCQAAKRYRNL